MSTEFFYWVTSAFLLVITIQVLDIKKYLKYLSEQALQANADQHVRDRENTEAVNSIKFSVDKLRNQIADIAEQNKLSTEKIYDV